MTNPAERLKELGLTLPRVAAPVASYVAMQRAGNLLFVSGQLPRDENGVLMASGLVGRDVTLEKAYEAAQLCGLHILAHVNAAVGLGRIKQCVKLTGFVACVSEFTQQPQVVNGASELMVNVFGDKGQHSRSAVGVASLPLNAAVEVEAVFEFGP